MNDIVEACKDADLLFFVIPHQFLAEVLAQMKGHIKSSAIGVSLIKGLKVGPEGPMLLSTMIQTELGLDNSVAVVMGANIANEVYNYLLIYIHVIYIYIFIIYICIFKYILIFQHVFFF